MTNSPALPAAAPTFPSSMIDLDRFKCVNDTQGHLAGDAVLREAAARLKSASRRYDSVGRYGGEEFLVVLPGCDLPAAQVQAERLRDALARTPFRAESHPIVMTASLGLACSSHCAPEVLIREADDALYLAKSARPQSRSRPHRRSPPVVLTH